MIHPEILALSATIYQRVSGQDPVNVDVVTRDTVCGHWEAMATANGHQISIGYGGTEEWAIAQLHTQLLTIDVIDAMSRKSAAS
jgi:hypothetical protein